MQPSEVAFIGVGGTLLGVIVGGFIGYYFSRKAAVEQMRRVAGVKLRAAFAPIIAEYIFKAGKGDFYLVQEDIFKNALVSQGAAIEEYRWFVPPERQRAYQQAWENYYWKYGGLYFTDYVVGDDKEKLFKQRINAILKFTEE